MKRFSQWFLPHTPDLLAVLRRQAATTVTGVESFARWSAGDESEREVVNRHEHLADDVRRELQTELRRAFSTALEPEDIYELSERLDAVLNAAKNAVREADVMNLRPDEAMARMAEELAGAVRHLAEAFACLATNPTGSTAEADEAIKRQRNLERLYRVAMSDLLKESDIREVIARREMYRRYARLGDLVVRVAERVWYAVVKQG